MADPARVRQRACIRTRPYLSASTSRPDHPYGGRIVENDLPDEKRQAMKDRIERLRARSAMVVTPCSTTTWDATAVRTNCWSYCSNSTNRRDSQSELARR